MRKLIILLFFIAVANAQNSENKEMVVLQEYEAIPQEKNILQEYETVTVNKEKNLVSGKEMQKSKDDAAKARLDKLLAKMSSKNQELISAALSKSNKSPQKQIIFCTT